MIILGIDPSVNSTGLCVYNDETRACRYYIIPSHMTKKMAKYRDLYLPYEKIIPSKDDDYSAKENIKTINFSNILYNISTVIESISPDYIIMEGVSYGSTGSAALVDLAGLNFMIRSLILKYNIPFTIVSPSQWKKQMLGNGQADKEMIIDSWRRLEPQTAGIEDIKADDIADAYFLAHYRVESSVK